MDLHLSETWSDLEVLIDSANHMGVVYTLLWRLRERVELPVMETRWDEIVSCPSGEETVNIGVCTEESMLREPIT